MPITSKPKHAVTSEGHELPNRYRDTAACRCCKGTGQIKTPGDCPRCEGDGTDRFYGVDRPWTVG